jgi:hypothetical protein
VCGAKWSRVPVKGGKPTVFSETLIGIPIPERTAENTRRSEKHMVDKGAVGDNEA